MAVVQAVMFDLDDTLVDHQHASHAAVMGVRDVFVTLQARTLEAMVAENERLVEEGSDGTRGDVARAYGRGCGAHPRPMILGPPRL